VESDESSSSSNSEEDKDKDAHPSIAYMNVPSQESRSKSSPFSKSFKPPKVTKLLEEEYPPHLPLYIPPPGREEEPEDELQNMITKIATNIGSVQKMKVNNKTFKSMFAQANVD
jgi:hypothetical protein